MKLIFAFVVLLSVFSKHLVSEEVTLPIRIQHILCSVTDKTGLVDFIEALKSINPEAEIVASGGTLLELSKAGIRCTPIKEYTHFPECFGGRVKTIHPKIEGGILFRRDLDEEEAKSLRLVLALKM